ncbi:MAG: ABC transporter substrate-binding protein [Rhizobiaceae bacterium]|nr:ABC transporter substrate-binding protein [Rhizobiaceae bacterium]
MRLPSMLSTMARIGAAALALVCVPVMASATDDVAVFPDPSRVVAIGGSITEIVYALGEQDKLVARDSTSVYPQAALALPDVGYMRALSPEGVLSVNPTAILALHGSGPREAVDVLKKASVPYVEVPESFDHKGILAKIHVVGKALGADAAADQLAAKVDAQLQAAESLTAGMAERQRVLFVLSLQGGKLMAAGSGTAAEGIIKLAGAVNAVEGFAGYKQLSDEAAIGARPDIILMMDRGGDHSVVADELFALPAIASTPAGQARRLIHMDASYLLGFGPRTADAIRDLATALYGDRIAN